VLGRWPERYSGADETYVRRRFLAYGGKDVVNEGMWLWSRWDQYHLRRNERLRADMGTYRAWLSEQEGRQDMAGWYARYWTKVTPGRISSPSGIESALARRLKELIEADPNANTLDEGENVSHCRYAIEAHPQVLAEYHGREKATDGPQPNADGLATVTPLPVVQQGTVQPGATFPQPQDVASGIVQVVSDPAQQPGTAHLESGENRSPDFSVTMPLPSQNADIALGQPLHVQVADGGLLQPPPGGQDAGGSIGMWQVIPATTLADEHGSKVTTEQAMAYVAARYGPGTSWPEERMDPHDGPAPVNGAQGWPERFWRLERKLDLILESLTALLQQQAGAPMPANTPLEHPRSLDADGWARMVTRHPSAALVMPWSAIHAMATDPGEDAAS
jgi:hypothetical protein